jgi:citronellol/citronellal dehydrogenase
MYDKMMNLNVKSTYGLISASAPHLLESDLGHVVSISPPLSSLHKKWIHPHPIYTLSKFGMSIVTLGLADPIKANTLWPSKLIKTAATSMIEKSTGIPSFTQGLSADHFVEACLSLLQSDHCGSSFLDSDIVTIPDGGIVDIFI